MPLHVHPAFLRIVCVLAASDASGLKLPQVAQDVSFPKRNPGAWSGRRRKRWTGSSILPFLKGLAHRVSGRRRKRI